MPDNNGAQGELSEDEASILRVAYYSLKSAHESDQGLAERQLNFLLMCSQCVSKKIYSNEFARLFFITLVDFYKKSNSETKLHSSLFQLIQATGEMAEALRDTYMVPTLN